MRSRVVLGIVTALVLGGAGTAAAEAKRVGVPRFDGPQEGTVRKAVMQVLKNGGYEVVGSHELDAAAKSTGAQLDSNDGFKAVAKELSISSFVTGEVSKKKAKLTVRNGADGSVSGEGSFAGANPKKVGAEVRGGFARRLGSAVERGRAPSGAKKPTVAAAPEQPEEAADDSAGGDDDAKTADSSSTTRKPPAATDDTPPPEKTEGDSGSAEAVVAKKAPEDEAAASGAAGAPRALDLSAGFRGFSRSLTYTDDRYRALRNYKLALGPAVALDVVAYPLGFLTSGVASYIGAELHLERAFGVSSNVPPIAGSMYLTNGGTVSTTIHDYWGGLRLRLPFGANEVSLAVGGGEHAFVFRPQLRSDLKDTPDTIYHYYRIGLDARFALASGLRLGVGFAYRGVLNQGGQISDPGITDASGTNVVQEGFFPFLQVRGIEANVQLGYEVVPSLEVRVTLDLRRYGFAMNSAPSDFLANGQQLNQVAGGAVDQYIGGTIGIAYVFGGVAPGAEPASEEAPAEAPKKKKHKKKAAEDDDGDKAGDKDSAPESTKDSTTDSTKDSAPESAKPSDSGDKGGAKGKGGGDVSDD